MLDWGIPQVKEHIMQVITFEDIHPNWVEDEAWGERFLSERDFPVYDDSADMSRVPDSDWEAYFADNYSDPMEFSV